MSSKTPIAANKESDTSSVFFGAFSVLSSTISTFSFPDTVCNAYHNDWEKLQHHTHRDFNNRRWRQYLGYCSMCINKLEDQWTRYIANKPQNKLPLSSSAPYKWDQAKIGRGSKRNLVIPWFDNRTTLYDSNKIRIVHSAQSMRNNHKRNVLVGGSILLQSQLYLLLWLGVECCMRNDKAPRTTTGFTSSGLIKQNKLWLLQKRSADTNSNPDESQYLTQRKAKANRWPPESCSPPSPTSVSYPKGNSLMKSCALAWKNWLIWSIHLLHTSFAASTISSIEAPGLARAMLDAIVPVV
jgi:hypothetical protein